MRIAVWHNLPSGGGKRALYDHVRQLVARGHAVTAWCPPTADTSYLSLKTVVPEHVLPLGDRPQLPAAFDFFMRQAGAYTERLRDMQAMLGHAAAFAEIVNRGDFDVVLANSCGAFFTPFVGRYLDVPAVLYLQEPCRRLFEARPELPWLTEPAGPQPWWGAARQWLGDALRVYPVRRQAREEWTNIRSFDPVLVNSRFSRESVLRAHGVDAKVCYLGIDTDRFVNADRDRDPIVLSVGEFGRHKNPLFVIEAVGASRRKPALTWVANRVDGTLLEEGNRLAAQLGVTLVVKANVPEDDLVAWYQRASVFAYAPRLEPFGFTPLEASACGAPVVAVAEGGVRETVRHGETGLVVDADPRQMGAAIDELMDNPSKARAMGQAGAQHVRSVWTLAAAGDRLEGHLVAAAKRPRRTASAAPSGATA